MWALIVRWTCTAPIYSRPAAGLWRWTLKPDVFVREQGRQVAAGKAAGRIPFVTLNKADEKLCHPAPCTREIVKEVGTVLVEVLVRIAEEMENND